MTYYELITKLFDLPPTMLNEEVKIITNPPEGMFCDSVIGVDPIGNLIVSLYPNPNLKAKP